MNDFLHKLSYKPIMVIVSVILSILLLVIYSNRTDIKVATKDSNYEGSLFDMSFFHIDSTFFVLKYVRNEDKSIQTNLMISHDRGEHWSTMATIKNYGILSNNTFQKGNYVFFSAIDTAHNCYLIKMDCNTGNSKISGLEDIGSIDYILDNYIMTSTNYASYKYDLNLNFISKKEYNRFFYTHSYCKYNDAIYCLGDSCIIDIMSNKVIKTNYNFDFSSYSNSLSQILLIGRNKEGELEIDCFDQKEVTRKVDFPKLKFVHEFKVELDGFIYAICKKDYNTNYTLIYSINNGKDWNIWNIDKPIVDGTIYFNKKLYIFVRGLIKPAAVIQISPYSS